VAACWTGALLLVAAGRLLDVQVIHGRYWATQGAAERGGRTVVPLPASRGQIVDRNGRLLAISIPASEITADPALIPAPQVAAEAATLGGILSVPAAQISTALSGPGQYAVVQPQATAAQGEAVSALNLPGITVLPATARDYPEGFFAGHILGFVNQAGGVAGVEQSYNHDLAGTNGYEVVQWAPVVGGPITGAPAHVVPPKAGLTLQLTIDSGLQAELQQQLERAIATTGATAAYGIVLQPQTGAILAASSWPTFDPNTYSDASVVVWGNTVAGTDVVPGSVFKPITLSAVLTQGVAAPTTPFFDPGYLSVGGVQIHDFTRLATNETLLTGFEQSSNVVFGTVGMRLGASRFYQNLQAFGLTQAPQTDLPGAQGNVMYPESGLTNLNVAEESFGEGLEVTPLSLISALNVVADGGRLIEPHIGQALIDPATGRVVRRITPTVVRQVIPASVAATVRQMMVSVVNDGTGNRAFIPCYDVGGKTGTSNLYGGPTGILNSFVASFVAMAPASNPAAIVLIQLVAPKGPLNEGGEVAAPVAQVVLRDALHTLGVPPACTASNRTLPAPGTAGTTAQVLYMVSMPDVVGMSPAAGTAAARQVGLYLHVTGGGAAILRQDPEPGAMVQQWTSVQAYTTPAALVPTTFQPVPNVLGDSMAQASAAATQAGFALVPSGAGHAVRQEPPAGTMEAPGSSIQADFR
jgi:cell division protein FtsI/penicillin-binding protein 2